MQIRPTAFTIGLIIHSFIALFFVYTEFGIDSPSQIIEFLCTCLWAELVVSSDAYGLLGMPLLSTLSVSRIFRQCGEAAC